MDGWGVELSRIHKHHPVFLSIDTMREKLIGTWISALSQSAAESPQTELAIMAMFALPRLGGGPVVTQQLAHKLQKPWGGGVSESTHSFCGRNGRMEIKMG